jgi:hypothetical protein
MTEFIGSVTRTWLSADFPNVSKGSPKVSEICRGNRVKVEFDDGLDPINSVCANAVGRKSPAEIEVTSMFHKINF